LIVGIDVGTQSLKAIVADRALRLRGRAARAYRPHYPRPGWAEQDPRLWETALGPAIAAALSAAGVEPGQVEAIGLCGQLDGCIAVDDRGGALADCILWMDRRARAEIANLPAERIRACGGLVLDASHMAAKIRWFKTQSPERGAIRRFHQPVSYLVERLTGATVIDHALASTSMVYSLAGRRYDPELLELFEIEERELPPLGDAGAPAGRLVERGARLTGLPAGIPVAVGTGDDFSTPLGAGLVDCGTAAVVLGTGEVVGAIHPRPLIDETALVETHAYPGGAYFVENPGWLCGGGVTWLADLLGLDSFAAFDRLAAETRPAADGLLFLPALTGAMAPQWAPEARGCFYGLTLSHGPSHLARALLEGCAFAMRDVIERLSAMGLAVESILLLGGGARSRNWAQIRADIAGLPVTVARETDSSAVGAAMLAGVAAGLFGGIREVAGLVGGTAEQFLPIAERRNTYDEAHAAYRRLFQSLKPMFGSDSRAAAGGDPAEPAAVLP
jgi:xylulokinase